MSSKDFVLSVEGLTVSFDGFKAVDDLSFYVEEGEIRVIIGPNGAGKTTVLDLICGRTKSTEGSIKFRGKDLSKMTEHEIVHAGVGRKFQNPSVYEDLTVFENFELSFPRGRSVFGALGFQRDAEVLKAIEETAEMVFLQEHLGMQADLLSHGQKQWLEIGMLLVSEPRLLLVDEPVAGMTAQETESTAELLTGLAGKRTVIVVEHDMDFVRKLNCKVTVLHEGSVLAEGSLDHVTANQQVIDVYLGR